MISPPWVAIREVTTPKIFAAEKIARYRAICVALDVSSRNTSAAVPVVQSDPKSKRGNSHQRRRQGRRERRQGQKSSPPRKIVIYRTIRTGLGPDASNASAAVPAVQSDSRSKQGAPNQRQRRGGDKTKNHRRREKSYFFSRFARFLVLTQATRVPWFQSCCQIEIPRETPAGTETPPKVR